MYDSSWTVHYTVLPIVVEEEVGNFGNVVEFVYRPVSAIHNPLGIDVPLFGIVRWDLEYVGVLGP